MLTRRKALISGAAALAGSAALLRNGEAEAAKPAAVASGTRAFTPVTMPNGATLPWTMVDGARAKPRLSDSWLGIKPQEV